MKSKHVAKVNGRFIRMAIASALAFGSSTAGVNSYAGSATSNLTVNATVVANCTIVAGTVAFGNYDPITAHASAHLDGTGTLSVNCTTGSAAKIMLGQGANADVGGGSTDAAPVRRMKDSGTNYLSYQLYTDSAGGTVWGNTDGTHKAYTGAGISQNVTVYGRVSSGQNKPATTYSDSVVATINF